MTRFSQRRRDQEATASSSGSQARAAEVASTSTDNKPIEKTTSRKRATSSTTTSSNLRAAVSSARKRSSTSAYPARPIKRSSPRSKESNFLKIEAEEQEADEDEEDELTDLEAELQEEGEDPTSHVLSSSFNESGTPNQGTRAPLLPASEASASGVKIRRGGGNRKGTAPEARAIHNATERARRESITNRIHDLGSRLPSLTGVKRPGKPRIITEALTFVSDARGREIFYRKQIAHLSLEKEKLEKMVEAASKGEVLDLVLGPAPSPYTFKLDIAAAAAESSSGGSGARNEMIANRDRNLSNVSNNSTWQENKDVSGMVMNPILPSDPRSQMSYHSSSQGSMMTSDYSPSVSSAELPPSLYPHPIASTFSSHGYSQGFDEHFRRASIAAPGYQSQPHQAPPFYSPTFPPQQQARQQPHPHEVYSSLGGNLGGQHLNALALQRHSSHGSLQPQGPAIFQQPLQATYPQSPSTSSNPQNSPVFSTSLLSSVSQSFQPSTPSSSQAQYAAHVRAQSEAGLQYSHYESSPPTSGFQRLHKTQPRVLPSPLSGSKEMHSEGGEPISSFE